MTCMIKVSIVIFDVLNNGFLLFVVYFVTFISSYQYSVWYILSLLLVAISIQ